MEEIEALRGWLRWELNAEREEFKAIWGWLEKDHRLSEYHAGEIDGDDLLIEASRLQDVLSRVSGVQETVHSPPPRRTPRVPPQEVAVKVSSLSQRRAQAFSEVAAALAQDHPGVRSFREHFLDGRSLSHEEAGKFLDADEGLEELRSLGKKLRKAYRWREGEAEWFVLTEEPPPMPALSANVSLTASTHGYHPNTAEITLTVQPWVTVEEVARVYRDIQRQVIGGDNRKLEDRTLAAVRFVAERIRERGAEPWLRRVERWNREHPRWRYASFRGLRQAFERFVHPHYQAPKYEPYEPTAYQRWRDERRRLRLEQLDEQMGSKAAPVNLGKLQRKS